MLHSSRRLLVLAWPGLFSLPALAAESTLPVPRLEPILVTAARTPQGLDGAPIGASIITAADIERSGVSDANEAIRRLGGVVGRTDLSNGREYSLDLRGFGATADQNIVVLVDGIRLSENELIAARLSAIPLEQIERIEIVRGGASVAWGEGASAGVINVILKHDRAARSSARVSVARESFDGQDVRASGTLALGKTTVDGSLRRLDSDGYRDNGDYEQAVGSLGVRWADGGWQAGLRVQHEDQDSRLPGALTFSEFEANPRQTNTPDDFYKLRETLYIANVQYAFGPWTAAVDVGHKDSTSSAQYFSGFPYVTETDRRRRQVSPRLTYEAAWGDASLVATAGLDRLHWDFENVNSYGQELGEQTSRARYVRAELTLPSRTRLAVGGRRETVVKQADTGFSSYERRNDLRASEFAISQTVLDTLEVYGRAAKSYRLPTIDENRYTPMSEALRPQRNKDREVGLKWRDGAFAGTVRWFRQKSVDEIAYVTSLFANANIDPTRRKGYEVEGRWNPVQAWTLSATWQDLQARYRSGPNAGKDQVLVAPRTATLRAAYQIDDRQTLDAGVQYVAAMRFGDDVDNQCSRRIPRSTLLDARYAWSDKAWTVAISGTNLTERKSYNYAFSCATGGLYPEPARAVKLTVGRQF